MRRREFIRLLSGAAAWPIEVRAQQPTKVPRIGSLSVVGGDTPATRLLSEAFLLGLHEHGYVEGENIAIIELNAEGRLERLPHLAAELVRLNVDLIFATTIGAARAARQATTTIPIVCPNLGDPVGECLAASLARPGGNVTGFHNFADELVAKNLSLLKEAMPAATRVAGCGNPARCPSPRQRLSWRRLGLAHGCLDSSSSWYVSGARRISTTPSLRCGQSARMRCLCSAARCLSTNGDASPSSPCDTGCHRYLGPRSMLYSEA